jgi:hypothetical protein
VTIIGVTADDGFVRGNRSQLFVYPGGNYCEERGPENATLMDSTGTRDAHGRGVSMYILLDAYPFRSKYLLGAISHSSTKVRTCIMLNIS